MNFSRDGTTDANDQATEQTLRRTRVRGPGLVLPTVVAVSVGLLAAGCGGAKPRASVASLGSTTTTATTPAGTISPGGAVGDSGPQATSSGGGAVGELTMAGAGGVAQMSKYAGCMRKNGVPNFPDPNAQGQISISSSAGIDPGSAQFQQAQQTCQKLLPNGGQPSPAQQAQARTHALAFSACMRAHGEPNFPDPQFGPGGRVTMKISVGAGLDPRLPQFQAAQTACQKDRLGLPGAAPAGAVGSKVAGG